MTADATPDPQRTATGPTGDDLEHARRLARAAGGRLTPDQIAVVRRLFGRTATRPEPRGADVA